MTVNSAFLQHPKKDYLLSSTREWAGGWSPQRRCRRTSDPRVDFMNQFYNFKNCKFVHKYCLDSFLCRANK
jgi:hypothetical protein